MTRRFFLAAMPLALVRGGSTIRGRLVRIAPNGQQYPAPRIGVRVYQPNLGPSAFSYTGDDGMYYIPGIPPGQYQLQVWITSKIENALLFAINVLPQQFTDIAPIRVP